MQAISLFTGIGGFEIAFNQVFGLLGKVIQSVEIDPDAQSVLLTHFPSTPIHSDISTYNPDVNWNYADGLVFGGSPCDNTSCAGDRTGLRGSKSRLWFEMLRVIATAKPRFVLVENPTGLINRGLRAVLGGLRMAGYTTEVEIVSAASVGSPHERERVFVVAYPQFLFKNQKQPPCWADQVRTVVQKTRVTSSFPVFEQRDDGVAYGFSVGLDGVPICVPQDTPGRIRSRYLYGRSVVPGCAAVAFSRIKFLQEWWRDD